MLFIRLRIIELWENGFIRECESEEFFDWSVKEAVERFLNVRIQFHWFDDELLNERIGKEHYRIAYDISLNQMHKGSIGEVIEKYLKPKCGFLINALKKGSLIKVLVTYTDLFIVRNV
jgi:hypothetical protein